MNRYLHQSYIQLKRTWHVKRLLSYNAFTRQHLLFSKEDDVSSQLHNIYLQKRQFSGYDLKNSSIVKRLRERFFKSISDKSKVTIGACLCYEKCADEIDYNYFLNFFKLPDTFYSWFLFIQLHVWMIAFVAISESNGRIFRNRIVEEMWNDVELRLEKLHEMRSSTKKEYLKKLLEQFQAALISYDEGILVDDKSLAAALWRVLFGFDKELDPRLLETAVAYTRRQISHLDSINSEELMYRGKITFLPLKEVVNDMEKSDYL